MAREVAAHEPLGTSPDAPRSPDAPTNPPRSALSGTLLVLAAAGIFSTGGAALKACSFPDWQVAGLRGGVAALAMALLVPASRRGWTWRTLLVGGAYAATLLSFAFSTRLTTAANAIFLQSTAPIYLLLLSPLLLKEKIARADVALMGALVVGLVLCFRGSQDVTATAPNPALGNAIGAACGIAWAFSVTGLRWLARREAAASPGGSAARGRDAPNSAAAATVAGNLIAFAVCIPFAWPLASGTPGDWITIGYLGVVQVALAYTCLVFGVRTVPAFQASLLLLLEPVLNPVITWLVHGEEPGRETLLGGAVIVAATILHIVVTRRGRAG